ncbi:MAG TPA: restriction endonuclease subunit S [Acidimicrobiales bacterium]|nr:restriction endonuclease subunit S [Acidimicrobiales bacterium]
MSDLPAGWEWTTLENLTDAGRPICYGILMPKEHVSDGVPYVKVKDFSRGSLDVAALRRTSPEIAARYQRSSLVGDDLLVSIRGTYGRVVIAPPTLNGANITQDTARVAVIGADHRYVARYLQSPSAARYFQEVARGVAVKGVNIGDLKLTPVPVPPRGEQERIVGAIEGHLSRIDAAEALVSAAGQRLDALERRLRDAAIEGEPVPLSDILREPLRNGLSAPTSSIGSIRVVTLTSVTKSAFVDAHTKLIQPGTRSVNDLWMEPGDIFVQRSNTPELVGTAALFDGPKHWAIFPDLLIRVRLDESRADPSYVELVLRSTSLRRYFRRSAQGIAGSMPKVSQPIVEAARIPLPPLERQRFIVRTLSDDLTIVRRMTAEAGRSSAKARLLRRAVLAAAFAGHLVPQDEAEEPASDLLKRVLAPRPAATRASLRRAGAASHRSPRRPLPGSQDEPSDSHERQR